MSHVVEVDGYGLFTKVFDALDSDLDILLVDAHIRIVSAKFLHINLVNAVLLLRFVNLRCNDLV